MANELTTYDLRISESQRQHLLTGLQVVINAGYLGASPLEQRDIDDLQAMLDDAKGVDPFFDPIMNDFTA